MAYKRYFYIKGKTYGPYYYQSYRDKSGKVRKRYVKKEDLMNKNKKDKIVGVKALKEPINKSNKSKLIVLDKKGIIRYKR